MLFSAAFKLVWRSLKDTWEEAFQLALNNLVWFFITVAGPLLAYLTYQWTPGTIVFWFTVGLAVLVVPLALAGIFYVTNRTANGNAIHVYDFFQGIKRYWWRSWIWLIANVVVGFLVYISMGFYTNLASGFFQILVGGFWLGVGLIWAMMQIYFWPMLMTQQTPNLLRAWRNAFVLVVREPLYSLLIGICLILISFLCVLFPIAFMLIYMAIFSLICNNATLALLIRSGAIESPRPQLRI